MATKKVTKIPIKKKPVKKVQSKKPVAKKKTAPKKIVKKSNVATIANNKSKIAPYKSKKNEKYKK